MPASNFGSSDYITLEYLIDIWDLEHDDTYMSETRERIEDDYADEIEELREDDGEDEIEDFIEQKMEEYIQLDVGFWYEDTYDESERLIDEADLNYISAEIESGYYEGFYLQISMDLDLEDEIEKESVYEEISRFGELLNALVDLGWSTGGTEERAREAIADAIVGMMEDVATEKVYDPDEPEDWNL